MNILVKIGSLFVIALIILVTFTSVVGYQSVQPNGKNLSSPLFNIRTQRAIDKVSERSITSEYLGKGKTLYLFTSLKSGFSSQLDKAIKFINDNPGIIQKLLERISKSPQMMRLFQQHGLSITLVKHTLAQISENPELLKNQLNELKYPVDITNDSQPLGLDTSSVLGCFVTVLILLPLAILIGVLVATILVITCFNIGNCFETIVQAILNGMLQGLD
ncbi:hypothetical protein AYK25_01655 [Thermoplasmatales archaeon SM1-50]|nr:MAG: hypothetical protein AYK25_01655 [Thermoplasmatales archaeon SM1-50]